VRAGSAFFGAEGRTTRALLLRYLLLLTAMNLAWEFAQMPLYTIGQTGTPGEIAFAALHCTAGDVMIGGFAMLAALMLVAPARWPRTGSIRVPAMAVAFGLAYTVFSEWLNVEVRESWAYSELMPRVPPLGTGLSPILQWLIIPPAAYFVALRAAIVRGGRAGRGLTWPQL
jgi:hypothetical protein